MSIFSRLLAVLKGVHSFPQPIRRVMPIVLLLASSLATPYLVARTSGRIAGVVKDASGAVIPNSAVATRREAPTAVRTNTGVAFLTLRRTDRLELTAQDRSQSPLGTRHRACARLPFRRGEQRGPCRHERRGIGSPHEVLPRKRRTPLTNMQCPGSVSYRAKICL